ncbi:MAG: hypothetical protein O3B84_04720 [Chloroflexi bacterium]|nr:hypothetical protein [Chloroflexota bacterium]
MELKLLPNEKRLIESDTGELLLTNYRVVHETRRWSRQKLVSIMLQDLRSSEVAGTSKPVLMILGGALIAVGTVLANWAV